MKRPSAILMSDPHIDEKKPVCRTDDFMEAQKKKWQFVSSLCKKNNVPLLIAGDIFDHHKPSHALVNFAIKYMPRFIAIPGNHDLFGHQIDYYGSSGLSVLESAGKCIVASGKGVSAISPSRMFPEQDDWMLFGFPFGVEMSNPRRSVKSKRSVAMVHQIVIESGTSSVIGGAVTGLDLLKKHDKFDLILSGDNHQKFTEEHRGRLLVNQGGITRRTIAHKDDKPSVFMWYAEDNSIDEIAIPIESGVISISHKEKKEFNDSLIDSYIDSIQTSSDIGINYSENMRKHLDDNKVEETVRNIIWEGLNS